MSNEEVVKLLDCAISLELKISELYLVYKELLPEYTGFWWQMVIEEKNHAALLETVKSFIKMNVSIPEELHSYKIDDLEKVSGRVDQLIKEIRANPSNELAFKSAYNLELSTGELHYQLFMQKDDDSKLSSIFRRLNKEDKDHASRIRSYMKLLNIS